MVETMLWDKALLLMGISPGMFEVPGGYFVNLRSCFQNLLNIIERNYNVSKCLRSLTTYTKLFVVRDSTLKTFIVYFSEN